MSGVKTSIAVWRQIEKSKNGYSQGARQRWSAAISWVKGVALSTARAVKLIAKSKECDCSSSWAIGVDMAYGTTMHTGTCYTGNIAKLAKATGFFRVKRYDNSKSPKAQGVAGGAFLTPGHHIVSLLDKGEVLNAVGTEKGTTQGGRPGDQTGREVRIDKWYNRAGGCVYNIVPISGSEFKGQVLHLFAVARKSYANALAKLLVVSSADGPLFAKFMKSWEGLDKGLAVLYTAANVPAAGHAFVVLGGTVTQMGKRLGVVLPALNAFPGSKVLVTGGVIRDGKTEAAWMADWLKQHGVAATRIIQETKASSTIGNAKNSVPALKAAGITSVTLVSYESHLRRAMVLFLAAKLEIETRGDGAHPFTMVFLTPLAYRDKVIANTPASPATRAEIGKEVAYTLGLTQWFK